MNIMGSYNSKENGQMSKRNYLHRRNGEESRFSAESFLTIVDDKPNHPNDAIPSSPAGANKSIPLSKPKRKSYFPRSTDSSTSFDPSFHSSEENIFDAQSTHCDSKEDCSTMSENDFESGGRSTSVLSGFGMELDLNPSSNRKGYFHINKDRKGDGNPENDSCNNLLIDEYSFYGDDRSERTPSESRLEGLTAESSSYYGQKLTNEEHCSLLEKHKSFKGCMAKKSKDLQPMCDLGPLKQDQHSGNIKKQLFHQGIISNESIMQSESQAIKRDLKEKGLIAEYSNENYGRIARVRLPPIKPHSRYDKEKLTFVNKKFEFCDNLYTTVLTGNTAPDSNADSVKPEVSDIKPQGPEEMVSKVLDIDLM